MAPPNHHELSVILHPEKKSADIHDVMTLNPLDPQKNTTTLALHADYEIEKAAVSGHSAWTVKFSSYKEESSETRLTRIDISKPDRELWPDNLKIEFQYSGTVYDPLRSPSPSDENVSEEGLLLSGASYFYPTSLTREGFPKLVTFRLKVKTPADWRVVSQGRKLQDTVGEKRREMIWEASNPMEEIFLIADRFEEYMEPHGSKKIYAFLINKDPRMAGRYIQRAKDYLDFYEKLLGPYPYPKFALVENSRQTGFGMPSFTLLGSRIIRFPFILDTSYPHEILHNWWGNGVYIDFNSGNWSEGLTAYLSDHLLAELKGSGKKYRFQEMMKYLNYVNPSNDFPLVEFKSRDSMASQAVGYGKTLMMFQMLRSRLGNDVFLKCLQNFYKHNRFQFAGFNHLRESFESVSGKNLKPFFDQWTQRTGAPELELTEARAKQADGKFQLGLSIRQKQKDPAFELILPVAVWLAGQQKPVFKLVTLNKKEETLSLEVSAKPMAVRVDPYHEVFRRLDPFEVPPSIGQTFGAKDITHILPSGEEYPDLQLAYHELAAGLSPKGKNLKDDMLSPLPEGSPWVFGRGNKLAELLLPQLALNGIKMDKTGVHIEGKSFPWRDHSFVFTLRRPGQKSESVTWVIVGLVQAVPGLIRKLPHYSKYGHLVFKGSAPDNQLKGNWPSRQIGLTRNLEPGTYTLPPQPPLVTFQPGK